MYFDFKGSWKGRGGTNIGHLERFLLDLWYSSEQMTWFLEPFLQSCVVEFCMPIWINV